MYVLNTYQYKYTNYFFANFPLHFGYSPQHQQFWINNTLIPNAP